MFVHGATHSHQQLRRMLVQYRISTVLSTGQMSRISSVEYIFVSEVAFISVGNELTCALE